MGVHTSAAPVFPFEEAVGAHAHTASDVAEQAVLVYAVPVLQTVHVLPQRVCTPADVSVDAGW